MIDYIVVDIVDIVGEDCLYVRYKPSLKTVYMLDRNSDPWALQHYLLE